MMIAPGCMGYFFEVREISGMIECKIDDLGSLRMKMKVLCV